MLIDVEKQQRQCSDLECFTNRQFVRATKSTNYIEKLKLICCQRNIYVLKSKE